MKKQKTLTFVIIIVLLVILYPIFFVRDISNFNSMHCDQVEEPLLKRYCYVKKFEKNNQLCQQIDYKKANEACVHDAYKVLKKSNQIDFWPSMLRWFLPPIFLLLLVFRFKRYQVRKKEKIIKKKLALEKQKLERIQRENK